MIRVNRLFLLGILPCAVVLGMSCQGSTGVPNTPGASQPSRPSHPSKAPGVGDAAAIRGVWLLVKSEKDGKELPEAEVRGRKYHVAAAEIRYEVGKTQPLEFTYTLDPDKNPKTIDMVHKKDPSLVSRGIYELDGDTLVICLAPEGKDRPSRFTTSPDSGLVVMRLTREK